jgi:hypothetical protein
MVQKKMQLIIFVLFNWKTLFNVIKFFQVI